MPIRILEPQVIAQIAAGEVIERPASVVKELVENALDAGARLVAVEAARGGLDVIRVTDDGCGIAREELALAFQRHATSKLSTAADLCTVGTLGFRGEALPSIAAAADVEVVSCLHDPGQVGASVRLRQGRVVEEGPRGAPVGTSVTVRRLFQRQPARLKFLRSPQSEASQIATVVTQYSLAFPQVRFTLRIDGRLSLQTPGTGLRDAAAAAYGPSVASAMLAVQSDDGSGDRPAVISGLAAAPVATRPNRSYISLFVNRRWVRSRSLAFAVEETYRGLLPVGRFPIAILNLGIAPDDVDVNVHPTKAEVRFLREREVFAELQRCVRRTLADLAPVPALAAVHFSPWVAARAGPPPTPIHVSPAPQLSLSPPAALGAEQETIEPHPVGTQPRLPPLRPLGQVGTTYVVAEGPEGLYLIDQHAAHERVLFERLLSPPDSPPQGLLQPLPVELSPAQEQTLRDLGPELEAQGFAVEEFGERTYLVRSVPSALAGADIGTAVLTFLDRLSREDSPGEPGERVAASLACHAAVRAGQTLSQEEMRGLVQELEQCQMPRTCPHGRPTVVHLSAEALAREFRRR